MTRKSPKGSVTVGDPGDLSVIGNSSPRFRFGFNLNAEWNGFDLSAFFQGDCQTRLLSDELPLLGILPAAVCRRYPEHLFDFYRPTTDSDVDMAKHSQSYINAGLANQNLNARYPVLQSWLADKNLGTDIDQSMGLAIPQTNYLLNGAYLRIKNITLGYTLPSE